MLQFKIIIPRVFIYKKDSVIKKFLKRNVFK